MNKYKWDLQELRVNKAMLEHAYNEVKDLENSSDILENIDGYQNMIMMAKKNSCLNSFDDSYNDISFNTLIDLLLYSYSKKNLPYLDILLQSFLVVNKMDFNDDLNNYWIDADNNEIINFTYDFFKEMTTPKMTSEFLEVINKKNIININYSKDKASDYAGVTIFDRFLNKKYISVNRSNHLTDLSILPHEMFHYIFNDVSNTINGSYNSYYLTEVEGALANILFGEYFIKKASDDKYFFKDYYKLNYVNQVSDLVIRNGLLDALDKRKKVRFNKLNKYVEYYDIDKFKDENDLIPYLIYPEESIIKYALSYLVAVDLLEIYKKDREKAFYHLKNICFNKRTDSILTLLRFNEITFMDDGYYNLKKYIKK